MSAGVRRLGGLTHLRHLSVFRGWRMWARLTLYHYLQLVTKNYLLIQAILCMTILPCKLYATIPFPVLPNILIENDKEKARLGKQGAPIRNRAIFFK